ncbi:MAG: hypothetical protein ACOVRN_02930 [Flavobacterium sp.]
MKFYETHFEEYIAENNRVDLHPKLDKLYKQFPQSIHDFKNVIFYGPSGTGKYTQMLKVIKRYSHSELKYERKISISYNKLQYCFKVSDIHYEIDMSLLGCNSKLLWHDIYQQIIDIISAKPEKVGIIVCKYFHEIHSELLDNFYSYMQQNVASAVDVKFVLLTEELSFIPDSIIQCCQVISIPRPTKTQYGRCIDDKLPIKVTAESVSNIKVLHNYNEDLMMPYRIICNKILDSIIHIDALHYLKFRDILYDIFIYNLDISDCIWYILSRLVNEKYIQSCHVSDVLLRTYGFFQYYNNNYRPIYHVEHYFLYIANVIHIHNSTAKYDNIQIAG